MSDSKVPQGFVKIEDPDKPGDYLILAQRDFDSATHTPFGTKKKLAPAPPANNEKKPEAAGSANGGEKKPAEGDKKPEEKK